MRDGSLDAFTSSTAAGQIGKRVVPVPVHAHVCADEAFAEHLTKNGYHPRSSHHGDFLCKALVYDLVAHNPRLAEAAQAGRLVYQLNFDMGTGKQQAWNIDLVLGPPVGSPVPPGAGSTIRQADPSVIYAAVDAKGVMTEHGKARRNRQRDLTALHAVVHTFYPKAVAGGLVAINVADRFRSPLRPGDEANPHPKNIERLVAETVDLFEGVPRATREGGIGMDAMGVFVVSYTNERGAKAWLVRDYPAPQPASPVYYANFLESFSAALLSRFVF